VPFAMVTALPIGRADTEVRPYKHPCRLPAFPPSRLSAFPPSPRLGTRGAETAIM